jgi:hypothetical protein
MDFGFWIFDFGLVTVVPTALVGGAGRLCWQVAEQTQLLVQLKLAANKSK